MAPSCALLNGFAIGARVSLLRQHLNAKCQRVLCTRCMPGLLFRLRLIDIVCHCEHVLLNKRNRLKFIIFLKHGILFLFCLYVCLCVISSLTVTVTKADSIYAVANSVHPSYSCTVEKGSSIIIVEIFNRLQ